jgi:hypothetical protein
MPEAWSALAEKIADRSPEAALRVASRLREWTGTTEEEDDDYTGASPKTPGEEERDEIEFA